MERRRTMPRLGLRTEVVTDRITPDFVGPAPYRSTPRHDNEPPGRRDGMDIGDARSTPRSTGGKLGRDGGSGLGDLFLAERSGAGWTEVGPLRTNTPSDEYHASWSPDGDLVFVRRAGDGDLYSVPWADARP